jgi:hypothetical protein
MKVLALLAFGALALPAAADPWDSPCGHGSHLSRGPRFRPYRAVVHAYRVSSRFGYYHYQRRLARHHYYRPYYHRPYGDFCGAYGYGGYGYGYGGYGYGYDYGGYGWRHAWRQWDGPCHSFADFGHGYGHGYDYSPYVYYGFSPFVRSAELLSRLGTVFTVAEDAPGDPGPDRDGLPRERKHLVGSRFVQ